MSARPPRPRATRRDDTYAGRMLTAGARLRVTRCRPTACWRSCCSSISSASGTGKPAAQRVGRRGDQRAAGRHGGTAPAVPGGGVHGGGLRSAPRRSPSACRRAAAPGRSGALEPSSAPTWRSWCCCTRWPRTGPGGSPSPAWLICLLARPSPSPGGARPTAHPGTRCSLAAVGLGGAALTAWVLGDSVAYRYRRAYYASLEERAARLEAERDAQARIAAAAERARELEEQRARAVDESAARLRRIERDLHDGAQVRLAALAMTLGEIKENLDAAARPGRRRTTTAAPACWSARPTATPRRPWPSCGTWPGASTRRCSIAASAPRWPPWPRPARSRPS